VSASEIQQNLLKAGWPVAVVNAAMASLELNDKAKPKTEEEGKTATPAATASAPTAQPEEPIEKGEGNTLSANTSTPVVSVPPAGAANTATSKATQSDAVQDAKTVTAVHSAQPADSSGGNPVSAPAANTLDEYKIGAGDVLKITVWHEPDASLPSAIVLPNGRISVPLLHDIEVAGLTVPQLEKLLAERFSSFIDTPEVSVVVTGANSKKIYLSGKVKKEGPLPYTYEMTVMQALTEAGGVTDFAKKKGIYVLRTENGRQFKLPFDYAAVLKGEHLETNIQLIPGDMIVVP
jgi:polysaccharide biosynthesis/export protein